MSDITAGELAQLRGDMATGVMTEQVSVRRITRTTSQETGRWAETSEVIWSGVVDRKPASETRSDVQDAPIGELATALSYWEFSFPVGVAVVAGDRIVSAAGRVYDVLGQLDKSLHIATYVYAQERTSGPHAV